MSFKCRKGLGVMKNGIHKGIPHSWFTYMEDTRTAQYMFRLVSKHYFHISKNITAYVTSLQKN